jgi:2-oxoglutarate dehydrogenase E2 component (dihydrolipoamide succinyltransferase)
MGETLVRMPKLADTLVEGTLGQWLKEVGDEVRQGEPLASIETDKVTTEMTSPEAGTIVELLVAAGQTVPVETPIARIGVSAPPGETIETPAVAAPSPAAGASPAPKTTPVAARLLAELGIQAAQINSRASRITRADVLQHLQSAAAVSTPQTTARNAQLVPLSSMRRAIAEHMTRAYASIPMGQTVIAADVTRLVEWREQHKQDFQQAHQAQLTFSVLFVYALARALANNAKEPVNVGVAVAIDQGLIVPVLKSADQLGLNQTAQHVADLAIRARANRLTPGETQGALMTLTNVGSFGNLSASPIVPLGQIGILAPGLVEQRPLPGPDHGVRLGWRCLLSLMFDRRVFDDLAADHLLSRIVDELDQIPRAE